MTLMYVTETLIGMARIMKGVLLLSLLRLFGKLKGIYSFGLRNRSACC